MKTGITAVKISTVVEGMEADAGKEVVNLIQKLEDEGMSGEKIIEIIKYVETAETGIETNSI